MSYWLVKTEPETWSWDMQVACGSRGEAWTGVRNHTAKNNLAQMKLHDRVLFYHSGSEKAVVGIVEVVGEAYPDPTDKTGRFLAVTLAAVAPMRRPVSLAAAKTEPRLKEMVLVNNSRLSVQPVTEAEWKVIGAMGCVRD